MATSSAISTSCKISVLQAGTKTKPFLFKTIKYLGIGSVTLLALMFITPYVFSDRIKEEIKKLPTKN